ASPPRDCSLAVPALAIPTPGRAVFMNAAPQSQFPPVLRSRKPMKLREVRFEDHAQVVALAAKFDLHVEAYPQWTHLWANNPAYREIQDKVPMGWVLDH